MNKRYFRHEPSLILDYVKVKGKSKPVKIYEVYETESDNYYKLYENGFYVYLEKCFDKAYVLFKQAQALKPNDKAVLKIIKLVNTEKISPEWRWFYLFKKQITIAKEDNKK